MTRQRAQHHCRPGKRICRCCASCNKALHQRTRYEHYERAHADGDDTASSDSILTEFEQSVSIHSPPTTSRKCARRAPRTPSESESESSDELDIISGNLKSNSIATSSQHPRSQPSSASDDELDLIGRADLHLDSENDADDESGDMLRHLDRMSIRSALPSRVLQYCTTNANSRPSHDGHSEPSDSDDEPEFDYTRSMDDLRNDLDRYLEQEVHEDAEALGML